MLAFRLHNSDSQTARRYALRRNLGELTRRVAGFGLIVGVLCFLAWQIFANTMAVSYQTVDPQRALNWNPHNSTALLELAERQTISSPTRAFAQLEVARRSAEQALRSNPLAPNALTELGRIAESEGDTRRAAALMELAAKRALRDAIAEGWLVSYALNHADFAAAVSRLDIILRTHPDAGEQTLPLLTSFISDVRARPSLVRMLETNPPWRASFLRVLPSYISDLGALREFYGEMRVGPHSISQTELQPYLDRLVNEGLFSEAFAAWVETLPPGRRINLESLYNGAFQYPLSGTEFDWKIVESVGADVQVVEGPGGVQTLRAEFSGTKVDFHNVSHLLTLVPGQYRLTGEVEALSLRTPRGVWWRVFCAERPDLSLGQTGLVADSMPWQAFTLSLVVPTKGCEAQILQLELPARIALEQIISGVVSYRNLMIVPVKDNVESTRKRP
jgi:hypothetical protein